MTICGQTHTRSGTAGFSMIELLVTIVIVGIVTAAMLPVFVGAQQRSSGDQMRNVALNLGQDRIEKIRALDYDQITEANLNSPTFAGGQFGTTWAATSGTGGTKTFTIAYKVTEAGSGSTVYKKVDVSVAWTPPPFPVKTVQLTTFVSKQYAGPTITNLALSPLDGSGNVGGKPVVMTATIATSDISLMAVNGSSKGKVNFYVFSAANGTQVATATVNTGDAGNTAGGTYTWSWDPGATADGSYSFRAQAASSAGDLGNTWQRTVQCTFTGAPPQVTGLSYSPGDGRVTLNWNACTASDFDHYEVWMGTTSGGETNLGITPALTANSYIKTGLTNEETYYFVVYAVDSAGNRSPASAELPASPTSMPGVNPPTMPGNFAAVPTFNTAVLTWTASAQDATSTLAGYYIYRDGSTTPSATVVAASTTWSDTVAWSSTHTYRMRAYNAAGRRSPYTATISVTTGTSAKSNLVVTNTSRSPGQTIFVWVQSTTTGLWWTGNANPSASGSSKPGSIGISKNGGTGTWYQLPYDTYTVTTQGGQSQTLNPATTPTVQFTQ